MRRSSASTTKFVTQIAMTSSGLLPSMRIGKTLTSTVTIAASASRIVLECSFHHMNEAGYYDSWTEHRITVRPTFDSLDIHISGRNRNDIKEYLHEVYALALAENIVETVDPETREATYRAESYISAQ